MDWERLYEELEGATRAWSREELVVLLRDLIREYVIERGLPTGTPAQAATPDLTQLDFPGLVRWLKGNLQLPELELFSLDGERVIVDADGPRHLASRRPAAPSPQPIPTPAGPAAAAPRPAPQPPAEEKPAERSQPKLKPGFRGLEFD